MGRLRTGKKGMYIPPMGGKDQERDWKGPYWCFRSKGTDLGVHRRTDLVTNVGGGERRVFTPTSGEKSPVRTERGREAKVSEDAASYGKTDKKCKPVWPLPNYFGKKKMRRTKKTADTATRTIERNPSHGQKATVHESETEEGYSIRRQQPHYTTL